MGAILTQIDADQNFRVIAYASRKTIKHEKNYTLFLLEMHAAVWGMEHFSHYLKGRRFILFTDHKPLEKLDKVHTRTLHRIQEAMLEYDFEIQYKKGSEMPADYLSRNISSLDLPINAPDIIKEQQDDPQLSVILHFLKTGTIPPDKESRTLITKYGTKCFIENNTLLIRLYHPQYGHKSLVCLPTSMRLDVITKFHTEFFGGHEGALKLTQRLQLYYYWPNMKEEIQRVVDACETSQKRKTQPSIPPAKLQSLPILTQPNQRVHADLFGPLKTSATGKKFLLVMTDAFTKYVELVAIPNKEAETVAEAIFNHWICKYGIPVQLVTDQGKEFIATVCQDLWNKLTLSILQLRHDTLKPMPKLK